MKESACTIIGLYLTDICSENPYRWPLRRLLWWWRHGEKRLTELLSTALAAAVLGTLYFLGLTLFLLQLSEHGW